MDDGYGCLNSELGCLPTAATLCVWVGTRERKAVMSSKKLWACGVKLILLAALLMPIPAMGQQAGPIRIGVLHDLTGPLAQIGGELNEGVRLHMSEISNEVAGRKIELVFEDPETKVDPGLTKLRKMVERDKVHLVIGPVNSALAYAMRDYIHRMKVPTLVTQATGTDLTQGKASPYLFRTGFGSEQLNLPMGWYAYKKLGYRRAIVIALDHVSGREQAGGFMKTFKQLGGTVINEIYAPLGTPDWAPYLTRLRSEVERADVVVAIAWGADAIRLIKGYSEYGLKAIKPMLAHGSAVDEALLPSVGDTALGMTNYLFYTPTLDTPENRRFRDLMRKQDNKDPTNYHELGYLTAKVATEAIRKVNGRVEDLPALLTELRKTRFEAPQGPFRFDEKQNVIFDLHIRRVEKVDGKLVNVLVDRIPAVDQFWTPPQ